jgi:tuftelin-interacting protein 11
LEAERIPEIRHNIRLLVASAKSDIVGLAREAKALEERKKWVRDEDVRLKKIVDNEARGNCQFRLLHMHPFDVLIILSLV